MSHAAGLIPPAIWARGSRSQPCMLRGHSRQARTQFGQVTSDIEHGRSFPRHDPIRPRSMRNEQTDEPDRTNLRCNRFRDVGNLPTASYSRTFGVYLSFPCACFLYSRICIWALIECRITDASENPQGCAHRVFLERFWTSGQLATSTNGHNDGVRCLQAIQSCMSDQCSQLLVAVTISA